ncbi:hypothetical protein GCM10011529_28690 [Polymorphobacter glacialis]|uniref:Uncharacterized protein n=1 Tax=Sandarakinorhabdus glacialis TaxID=1614636 RepID=A0A917EB33_9SPHN|nr:hypothetical protein GCM10011529_28690 [Polymorphobacter glacialis]
MPAPLRQCQRAYIERFGRHEDWPAEPRHGRDRIAKRCERGRRCRDEMYSAAPRTFEPLRQRDDAAGDMVDRHEVKRRARGTGQRLQPPLGDQAEHRIDVAELAQRAVAAVADDDGGPRDDHRQPAPRRRRD